MSLCDIIRYWRCPKCQHSNRYDLTWQHFYQFKEIKDAVFTGETCNNCGTSFWVGTGDLVLSKDLPLTIEDSFWTD